MFIVLIRDLLAFSMEVLLSGAIFKIKIFTCVCFGMISYD